MPDFDPMLQPTPPAPRPVPGGVSADAAPVKLCLLVLFNHRFEANLPKLDWLYRPRFEHIRYLMPFYRGERADVIPVHDSSFHFQGFFVEVWKRLRSEGFTHYLVCADDMVLNPSLNDQNILEVLRIGPNDGYIKHLTPLADRLLNWSHFASSLVAFASKNGVNWQRELPSPEEATANLQAKGFSFRRLGWHNLRGGILAKGFFQIAFYLVLRLLQRRRDGKTEVLGLPYPVLSGNADIMVIPAAHLEKFSFYGTVLASMGVFVEVAAPTALALACPHVVQEGDLGGWVAHDWWLGRSSPEGCEAFCREHDYDLEKLLGSFDPKTLLLHPIKLSLWKYSAPGSTGQASGS